MINSKGQRANRVPSEIAVVPNRRGESQKTLEHAGDDPTPGPATVAFQVELALQGVVHRLDDLAKGPVEAVVYARRGWPHGPAGGDACFAPADRTCCCVPPCIRGIAK